MEVLAKLEAERGNPEYVDSKGRTASKEMCDFLILDISSLQLIPVKMIVYRQQYGSVNPTAVIVATFIITTVVFCKVMDGRQMRA